MFSGKIIQTILLMLFIFFCSQPVLAQSPKPPAPDEKLEAVITRVKEEKQIVIMDKKQLYQKLELLAETGSMKGKTIQIENGKMAMGNVQKYKVGDRVVVTVLNTGGKTKSYYITDYVRRSALIWLFLIFVGLAIVIGKKKGFLSVIGMIFSFYIIFNFVLPQILLGNNPVIVAIIAAVFIIPITFYLSHGINRKTTISVIGTLVALIITGVIAVISVNVSQLTGYASEEASFLQAVKPDAFNMQGLLLSGIIIGLLGILDDITISQAAIVYQLKKTSPKFTLKELYTHGMEIGTDHIASMVNTLVLVYAGAAMPLLLLFVNSPRPFTEVINYEMIAEEIVRTLVASIGLILAVPITTFLAAYFAKKE